ncbi:LysR family transcriptional regulator [Brevibacterium casei]
MDIRQLRQFLAVVDTGSFTKAAEAMLVAQPSLSQTIKGLERELGVSLFNRIGRTVSLSEAGREFEGPARLAVRDLDAAKAHIDRLRGLQAGRIEIAAMPSPSIEPLTALMATFTASHPQIAFAVDGTFTADETIESVRHGRVEIGFPGSREPLRLADLDVITVSAQPLMLARRRVPGAPQGSLVDPRTLTGSRFVVSHPGSLMRAYVDELISDGVDLEITAEVAHRTSIIPLVRAGIGSAVLPSAWQAFAGNDVELVPLLGAPSLHVSAISRPEGLTPAAAAFLAATAEVGTTTSV